MDLPSFATSQKLALGGAALLIGGAALPWTGAGGVAAILYRGDQFVGLMAGVSVLGIVLVRPWTTLEWAGVALFGGLTAYLAGRALLQLLGTTVGIGAGLPVQLLGGALAFAGGAYAARETVLAGEERGGGEEWDDDGAKKGVD